MMFINIAICDNDKGRIEQLRGILADISIQHDIDLQIYWLFGENMLEKLSELADIINLALISMDMNPVRQLGKDLYQMNPDCYIMYYKQNAENLEPLLCSRPIAFQNGSLDTILFRDKVINLFSEIWAKSNTFRFQSKSVACFLSYRNISHFESNYKHVIIHTFTGRKLRIPGKLDEIQQQLEKGFFLRVHKSFLVNMRYVREINRSQHCLLLETGENIPVSKLYYDQVVARITDFSSPG
jgi:hypothetical protein